MSNVSGDELRGLPGIGPKMADKLRGLGIGKVSDLKGLDPQELYERYQAQCGGPVDRCVLYVFRCAVYHAESEYPDPALSQWWHFKDGHPAD